MISVHDFKEVLIIGSLALFFIYALAMKGRQDFRKNLLWFYQYSIPFIGGYFITVLSLLGLLYSFYFAIEYTEWLFVLTCIGYSLVIYGTGMLVKFEKNNEKYQKKMRISKDLFKYLLIALLLLSLRDWFL